MKRLLLIDAHAIIHRAYHALPLLTDKDGLPTNAVYGFFTMLHMAVNLYKPNYLVICFDTPVPTFRKKLLKTYQANRPKMEDSLSEQIKRIHTIIDEGKLYRLELEGFEADDVIGTLAYAQEFQEMEVFILTGDKDILQLVDNRVRVVIPKIGLSKVTEYDEQKVIDTIGVEPRQIADFKALAGDPSDNYRAIKGLGPKSAIKILHLFHSIENLYERIEDYSENKFKEALVSQEKEVRLLKKIATIVRDVPIEINVDKAMFNEFSTELKDQFERYQFRSLLKRYFNVGKTIVKNKTTNIPGKHVKKINSVQDSLF